MNENCFDIGTIQAFLDGETNLELSMSITEHIQICSNCSDLFAEAEEQSSVVFAALDREMNSLVPTQRLWSKINATIEDERQQSSIWNRFQKGLAAFMATPSLAVGAALLVVSGLFAAIWSANINSSDDVAVAVKPTATAVESTDRPIAATVLSAVKDSPKADVVTTELIRPQRNANERFVTRATYSAATRKKNPSNFVPNVAAYLPGEESYIKTIDGLNQNLDGNKDTILNPAARIAYERDMAVVDDSITRMKQAVKKEPTNRTAQQLLLASYQNKVDLLTAVSERGELMASLK